MVGTRTTHMQDPRVATGAVHARGDHLGEFARRHVMRAGGDEHEPAGRGQCRRQPRELAIGAQRRRLVAPRLGEGRRVGDDHAEAPALADHALQRLHRLGALGAHARRHAVQCRGLHGGGERMLAAVEQCHLRRPRHRAADAEAAGMAERVEHGGPPREARDTGAVLALVEEPAGLLATQQVDREAQAVLLHHRAGGVAGEQARFPGEALEPAHRAVVARDDAARGGQRCQRLDDQRRGGLHSRGIRLQRDHIPVAVHDEAGQPVGLGMDQAVMGRVEQAVAQCQRLGQPGTEPGGVAGGIRVGRQAPRGNQRMGVEVPGAMPDAVIAFEAYDDAGGQGPGHRRHRDLVAEGPGVARLHAAIAAGEQTEGRTLLGHGGGLAAHRIPVPIRR